MEKFFVCKHCGNLITHLKNSGAPIVCCGEKMTEIVPGTVDASLEKHIPVIEISGNTVTVSIGAVEHPMVPEHYIEWIVLNTTSGVQLKKLLPGEKPVAQFLLAEGEEVVNAYEYCNLHGLWKK